MTPDSAPAYRVRLDKDVSTFLLVVDDEGDYSQLGDDTYIPERRVLHVERVAAHPVEADLQRAALDDAVFESRYKILTYTARSEAQAAGLAVRDHHDEWALLMLEDVLHADENAFPGIADRFHNDN
ncbi:hypothetical protein [Streptomyces sp. 4F14]|uniref:hypothetical protein n=1 Tax=Streptomyces sp. 4F14 TaxID=3394380 RepID=UPI003A84FB4D